MLRAGEWERSDLGDKAAPVERGDRLERGVVTPVDLGEVTPGNKLSLSLNTWSVLGLL